MTRLRATTALSGVACIGRAEIPSGHGPAPVATALRALTLVSLLAAGVAGTGHAARADGGNGGFGGNGGMDNPTGPGSPGGGGGGVGSGGGGSGTTGGNGGNGAFGGGGLGGTGAGSSGSNGSVGNGGGGGGAHGAYGLGLPAMAVQGGGGGNGGNSAGGGGGGGGSGGYGAVVTGNAGGTLGVTATGGDGGHAGSGGGGVAGGGSGGVGLYFTSGAAGSNVTIGTGVTGGTGGNGDPAGDTTGGAGGPGGVGIFGSGLNLTVSPGITVKGGTGGTGFYGGAGGAGISGSGLSIVNNGTIQGGNGGSGSAGNAGPGGIGITGSNLSIDVTHGTITGGMSGDGTTRAYAIQLTGGTNYVGNRPRIVTNVVGGIDVAGGSFQPGLPGLAIAPLADEALSVNGPIAFAPGTFYNVRITPTAADTVNASGAATLTGATVRVIAGYGTYTARSYTILNAVGGFGGTAFAGVTSNFAFLMPTLSYVGNDVILSIQAGTASAPPVISANGTPVPDYRTAAETQNQYNVASGLTEAGIQNGGTGRVLNALNQLTVAQAQAAFDSLSGEGITAAQNVANRSAQLFNGAIFDQTTFYGSGGAGNSITLTDAPPAFVALVPEQTLAAANRGQPIRELADLPSSHIAPTFVAPNRTWRAWASGFGGVEDIHGNGAIGSATQNDTIYGGTLGVDYQLTPNYLVGIALGGSDGAFQVPGRTTSGSTTGGHVAFYDLATFGQFYGASSNSFSYYDNKTTRSVAGFGGLGGETERGDFNSHEFRTRLEFGRHVDIAGMTLTPFVALEIADLRSNGFGETSISGPGLFRLNVSGQSTADVPGYLGARVQTVMPLGGMTFLTSLQMAWEHEFAPYRSQIGAIADLPGSTFLVTGAQPARDAAQVKAGGELRIGPHSALFANFDGEFSGANQLYAGKGGLHWVW